MCHFSSFSLSYVKHCVFSMNVKPYGWNLNPDFLFWFFVLILKYSVKNNSVICCCLFVAFENAINHWSLTIMSVKWVMSLFMNLVKLALQQTVKLLYNHWKVGHCPFKMINLFSIKFRVCMNSNENSWFRTLTKLSDCITCSEFQNNRYIYFAIKVESKKWLLQVVYANLFECWLSIHLRSMNNLEMWWSCLEDENNGLKWIRDKQNR